MIKNIHFIINPKAGKGKNVLTKSLVTNYFPIDTFAITINYTKNKESATNLTLKAINDGAQVIVACGGDGTINQIAPLLVDTNIKLGILPCGSGNGLSSHLNIPKNLNAALELISNQKTIKIDSGILNQHYFFSNVGISGFETNVINYYNKSGKHKISGYIKAIFKALTNLNSSKENNVIINDTIQLKNPFIVFISNSNEMGYNMSLTPKASLQDGVLDVVIVPRLSIFKTVLFGLYVICNKLDKFSSVIQFQTQEVKYISKDLKNLKVQVDGDVKKISSSSINISVKKKSLKVIT